MKLLLTSTGIANESIKEALFDLVGKPPEEVKVGFIPTAVNAEIGNKFWLLKDLTQLQSVGFGWLDIVDPSAADVDWRARLNVVDIVYVAGGNTFHLLDQTRKTGFGEWLQGVLKQDKVFVGSSAGSILAGPSIAGAGVEGGDENVAKLKDLTGLKFVGFEFLPHVSNGITVQAAERYAQTTENPLYAVDDQTAIKVDGNHIDVVSEGKWQLFND
jgi:dipeptidase E